MQKTDTPISSFTQLIVWQKGHTLVIQVYELTRKFPKEELFALTTQIRRCVVSITSNIAEGFSRRSVKDKSHFYTIALGSTTELQNKLLIARDLGYLDKQLFEELAILSIEVNKMINGLIKKTTNNSLDS